VKPSPSNLVSPAPIVPGISKGGREAITGDELEALLFEAGIPMANNSANQSVEVNSAADPYAQYFSPPPAPIATPSFAFGIAGMKVERPRRRRL
jgi:hypothetical protein